MPRSAPASLVLAPFVAATALLVWPLYPWLGDSVEPRVLGLPWSLVYVLLVIAGTTATLIVLYTLRIVDAEEHPEDDARG